MELTGGWSGTVETHERAGKAPRRGGKRAARHPGEDPGVQARNRRSLRARRTPQPGRSRLVRHQGSPRGEAHAAKEGRHTTPKRKRTAATTAGGGHSAGTHPAAAVAAAAMPPIQGTPRMQGHPAAAVQGRPANRQGPPGALPNRRRKTDAALASCLRQRGGNGHAAQPQGAPRAAGPPSGHLLGSPARQGHPDFRALPTLGCTLNFSTPHLGSPPSRGHPDFRALPTLESTRNHTTTHQGSTAKAEPPGPNLAPARARHDQRAKT